MKKLDLVELGEIGNNEKLSVRGNSEMKTTQEPLPDSQAKNKTATLQV